MEELRLYNRLSSIVGLSLLVALIATTLVYVNIRHDKTLIERYFEEDFIIYIKDKLTLKPTIYSKDKKKIYSLIYSDKLGIQDYESKEDRRIFEVYEDNKLLGNGYVKDSKTIVVGKKKIPVIFNVGKSEVSIKKGYINFSGRKVAKGRITNKGEFVEEKDVKSEAADVKAMYEFMEIVLHEVFYSKNLYLFKKFTKDRKLQKHFIEDNIIKRTQSGGFHYVNEVIKRRSVVNHELGTYRIYFWVKESILDTSNVGITKYQYKKIRFDLEKGRNNRRNGQGIEIKKYEIIVDQTLEHQKKIEDFISEKSYIIFNSLLDVIVMKMQVLGTEELKKKISENESNVMSLLLKNNISEIRRVKVKPMAENKFVGKINVIDKNKDAKSYKIEVNIEDEKYKINGIRIENE